MHQRINRPPLAIELEMDTELTTARNAPRLPDDSLRSHPLTFMDSDFFEVCINRMVPAFVTDNHHFSVSTQAICIRYFAGRDTAYLGRAPSRNGYPIDNPLILDAEFFNYSSSQGPMKAAFALTGPGG